ncbi:bacterial transcriptional activator domain-containing protein [Dictyobacter alpinus]|nr:bacterial transcriptional activator domain-containing protein [Dictyobacter alpinus]
MIYQLAEASQLWLDTDAQAWNVEQAARMERFGDDAQPFWERAYALGKRGSFLPDDRYVDWAVQRRKEVEGYYRQTIHALARLYVARYGTAGASESLLVLRTYWQQYPKDEDALRLLMQVLSQQERYQEAVEYYDQLCDFLQEDDDQPDERTKDIAEYCRTKQIQYGSVAFSERGKQSQQHILAFPFPLAVQDTLEISHVLDGAFPLNTSRRAMLQQIVGWVGATAFSPQSSVNMNVSCSFSPSTSATVKRHSLQKISTETLNDFSQLTETCRSLSEGNELKTAERVLWSYLPQVETLAQVQSPYQKIAAAITSQVYVLAASLVGHHSDLQSRQSCSERAIWYAECAQDVELHVAALRQLAVTFDYLALPKNVLQTYQRALPHLKHVSPRLQACIYSALSGVYAQLQHEEEAHQFMGLAYEKYPEDKQNEPGYLRTINASYHTLILWDGLNHLELGQPLKAHNILQQIPTMGPTEQIPERIRVEFLNYQARALMAVGDLEQACAYIETAVEASTAIGSRKRFQESFAVFQQMKDVWPTEMRIHELRDLFLQRMINHME